MIILITWMDVVSSLSYLHDLEPIPNGGKIMPTRDPTWAKFMNKCDGPLKEQGGFSPDKEFTA